MGSIVLDLQKDMVTSDSKVSDLLRKAYIIARKLKVKDFETWIHNELNGYRQVSEVPLYRVMRGEISCLNLSRWVPVIITNRETQKKVTKHINYQGIPELESILRNEESKPDIYVPLPDSYSQIFGYTTKYKLEISTVQLRSILETVKNIILEWSLKLEEDGIVGEDMGFSEDEKEKAEKSNYTVNNFYGDISGQIQQNTTNSTQNQTIERVDSDKINDIISLLKENRLETSKTDKKILDDAIETVSNEIKQATPSANIVKEAFKTIRNVLEGMTGSLIASGILDKIAKLPF